MDMFQHRSEEVAKLWGWFLALSVILVILGIVAISATVYTTLLTVLFLGALLMAAGIGQCVLAIRAPQWSGFFLNLLAGLLAMVLGYLFIQTPGATAVSLTLLMALYFIVSGLFKIFTALFHRFHQWGWMLGNGIVSLLLGILLWSQWPVSGFWAIGLFLGIDLLMAGTTWMILAFSLRKLQHPGHNRGRFAPQ
jgi:uncharacterized membrane protein HdeD (DUF308 family)